MAKVIKLRKGLDINLKGKATKETATVSCPGDDRKLSGRVCARPR